MGKIFHLGEENHTNSKDPSGSSKSHCRCSALTGVTFAGSAAEVTLSSQGTEDTLSRKHLSSFKQNLTLDPNVHKTNASHILLIDIYFTSNLKFALYNLKYMGKRPFWNWNTG